MSLENDSAIKPSIGAVMAKDVEVQDSFVTIKQIDTGASSIAPAALASGYRAACNEPRATFWCIFMLFTSIGWGYDNFAGSAVTGIATWRSDFGVYYARKDDYIVPIAWQYAYNVGGTAGMFCAALATGPIMERYGRRFSLMLFSLSWLMGASLQYKATSIGMYTGGKILSSLCQGGYLTISPSYVSEVAPTKSRGAFLAATNFFIVVGQFLGTLVQRATDSYAPGPKSYQILFAVQWGFAAIIFLGAIFLPESPEWCLRRMEQSTDPSDHRLRRSIAQLYGASEDRVTHELCRLRTSAAKQKELAQAHDSTGYLDCFDVANRRRTIISLAPPLIQVLCGAGFVLGYQAYFLQLTGISVTSSYTITMINYGIFLLGSLLGLLAVERLGRRRIFLGGCCTICASSLLISIVGEFHSKAAKWIFLILVSFWGLAYQATLGPIGWTIASESSSRRVRSKTISLVTMVNAFSNLIFYFINPAIINPDKGDLGTKAGFLYGAIMVLCSIFAYFCIPEMRGRTYDEIDEMFALKIKARNFRAFKTSSREVKQGTGISTET